jgi:2-oxoisovalerate dehydrogenase E1 component
MFADFLTLAADQLVNHAVKFAGMFPDTAVPLVIRTPCGGRRGYGPTHSQSVESLMTAVPGLTVVTPSHRHDPGLLLERAVSDWPYPTIFFEHKLLYGLSCTPGDYRPWPADARDPAGALFPTLIAGADRPDITLVTYGGMLPTVEGIVRQLDVEELAVRVVAISLLAPLPRHALADLLRHAGPRIVVIEEAPSAYGVGAEIGAVLLEHGYAGRFRRIGAPPVPIPAARSLEREVIPDDARILDEIMALCVA